MVMPPSRSRSIESSSCAFIERGSTVWVVSRMRSARVDFPWSMWAMIEKFRMWAWSATQERLRGGAPQPAADEIEDLAGLRQAEREHDRAVARASRRERGAERHDLADQPLPEQV